MKKDDGNVVPLGGPPIGTVPICGRDPSWKVENNLPMKSLSSFDFFKKFPESASTRLVAIYKDSVNEYIFMFWGKFVIIFDYDWNFLDYQIVSIEDKELSYYCVRTPDYESFYFSGDAGGITVGGKLTFNSANIGLSNFMSISFFGVANFFIATDLQYRDNDLGLEGGVGELMYSAGPTSGGLFGLIYNDGANYEGGAISADTIDNLQHIAVLKTGEVYVPAKNTETDLAWKFSVDGTEYDDGVKITRSSDIAGFQFQGAYLHSSGHVILVGDGWLVAIDPRTDTVVAKQPYKPAVGIWTIDSTYSKFDSVDIEGETYIVGIVGTNDTAIPGQTCHLITYDSETKRFVVKSSLVTIFKNTSIEGAANSRLHTIEGWNFDGNPGIKVTYHEDSNENGYCELIWK